jgi:DNA-binding NarL/FixJ family response regulator
MTASLTCGSAPRPATVTRRRVLIADDHRAFAEMFALALAGEPDLECVGVVTDGDAAVAAAAALEPDIVILDIGMPRGGVEVVPAIRALLPDAAVVMVTAQEQPQWVVRARRAGAAAFALKNGSLAEVVAVLRQVPSAEMTVAPSVLTRDDPLRPQGVLRGALTLREREVLGFLGEGVPPADIADLLEIRMSTLRRHMKSVMAKLGASTRLEAVVLARRAGLLRDLGG